MARSKNSPDISDDPTHSGSLSSSEAEGTPEDVLAAEDEEELEAVGKTAASGDDVDGSQSSDGVDAGSTDSDDELAVFPTASSSSSSSAANTFASDLSASKDERDPLRVDHVGSSDKSNEFFDLSIENEQ